MTRRFGQRRSSLKSITPITTECIGRGKLYHDDQYLVDVHYEIVIELQGTETRLSGCIYADENLERLFGGLLPELMLQLPAYQTQFRFLPLRADSVAHPYMYSVIPRGQLEIIFGLG